MRIDNDIKLDYSDVLIRPKRSTLVSRYDVTLIRTYNFRHSSIQYNGTPVMAANMDTIGTPKMAVALADYGMFTCLHKAVEPNFWGDNEAFPWSNVAVSTGSSSDDLAALDKLIRSNGNIDYICLDVANGYTEAFVDTVKKLRDCYPDRVIMAGNVVTGDMTEALIIAGADIVKIGIGPGSVCTTRIKTGVGYPQLSAVIECADAAHGLGGHIIADGGCTTPGDVAKAFAAGADFVMLGGMLAGHDECEGRVVTKTRTIWVQESATGPKKQLEEQVPSQMEFYGMSSKTAQEKHGDGLAEYRASEGKRVLVPYKGPVKLTAQDILGGLRSACTYVGARTLKDLSKCTTFVRVSNQVNQVFGSYNGDINE